MAAEKISGHCNCGRYKVTIPKPKDMNLCHCTDCRRWAGALHSAHLFSEDNTADFSGPEPRTFKVTGIQGREMTRAWCDGCGSGLWIRSDNAPGLTFFKAGLFEPGSLPEPTLETFTDDMEPWEKTQDSSKKWEKNFGGI